MKNFFFLLLVITATLTAQKKEITLEDIWTHGTFKTEGLNSFQSMQNGDY